MTPSDVVKLIKDKAVKFADLRFTDTRGKEQHVTIPANFVTPDFFVEGKMFDGSSIAGWKGINESDMILLPEAATAVLDPFFADATVNLRCDIIEPATMQGYERDPRSLGKRAEAYLKSTRIADGALFGPENEFFIFDSARWHNDMNGCGYLIDSVQGAWNSNTAYPEGNMGHRPGMLDNAADVVERGVGQAAVLVARKQRGALLLQRLVHVHPRAVVADQGLGHEGRALAVQVRDVVHAVLADLHFVGLAHQPARADADLGLPAGRHFVVVHLDLQAHVLERLAHRRADVLVGIDRRYREIAALDARPVAAVAVGELTAGIPGALDRVDRVRSGVQLRTPAHVVEDEELVLGTK